MSIARRVAAALIVASLGVGIAAIPAHAGADTSWGYIKPAKKGAIE